jgi:hypothetical protein
MIAIGGAQPDGTWMTSDPSRRLSHIAGYPGCASGSPTTTPQIAKRLWPAVALAVITVAGALDDGDLSHRLRTDGVALAS